MARKPPKFKGVSEEVVEILEANMDQAPARRRAREAFKEVQLSIDHYLFKVLLILKFVGNMFDWFEFRLCSHLSVCVVYLNWLCLFMVLLVMVKSFCNRNCMLGWISICCDLTRDKHRSWGMWKMVPQKS